jgi:hypothetical protein
VILGEAGRNDPPHADRAAAMIGCPFVVKRRFPTIASIALTFATSACGGSEFSAAAPDGGAGSGGNAGAVSGGGGTGGGSGGSGGVASGGGSGASCTAPSGSGLRFFSTLDGPGSLSNPQKGDGTNAGYSTNPADDFVQGHCGKGLRIDEGGEYIQLDESANFDIHQGTIDFWYLPDTAQDDGAFHRFVYTSGPPLGLPGLSIRKTDANVFTAAIRDTVGTYFTSQVTDFQFEPGKWIRIRVTWDVTDTTQVTRVYFDGSEASYQLTTPGPATVDSAASGSLMFVGANDAAGTTPIDGVIDELAIYDVVAPP